MWLPAHVLQIPFCLRNLFQQFSSSKYRHVAKGCLGRYLNQHSAFADIIDYREITAVVNPKALNQSNIVDILEVRIPCPSLHPPPRPIPPHPHLAPSPSPFPSPFPSTLTRSSNFSNAPYPFPSKSCSRTAWALARQPSQTRISGRHDVSAAMCYVIGAVAPMLHAAQKCYPMINKCVHFDPNSTAMFLCVSYNNVQLMLNHKLNDIVHLYRDLHCIECVWCV